MSKKLSPERLTEHLRTLRLAAHGNPFAAIAVIETAEHIEALETETAARGKVWAEQTVQRCDATAKIEALEAEHGETEQRWKTAHGNVARSQERWQAKGA